ncbi:MAG TPA: DUF4157 domain-containing protein [Pyrinomonadaceae bacterium]|jgi:hypothetical protein|nr:DUF4157 domain-containing protein [Pyrinomonadaceae bacterium]
MERQAVAKTQQNASARDNRAQRNSGGCSSPANQLLQLQQSVGNQGLQRLIRLGYLQTKLDVSAPEDPLEEEADRTAETVMRSASDGVFPRISNSSIASHRIPSDKHLDIANEHSMLQRVPLAVRDDDDEEKVFRSPENDRDDDQEHSSASEPIIKRKEEEPFDETDLIDRKPQENSGAPQTPRGFSSTLNELSVAGTPMSAEVRSFYENRFGSNFGGVRIHTGPEATRLTRSIQAKAFTHSNHIYFADNHYDPASTAGKKLVAHELAHVVQQSGGSGGHLGPSTLSIGSARPVQPKSDEGTAADAIEADADAAAAAVMNGARPAVADISLTGKSNGRLADKGEKPAPKPFQPKGTYKITKSAGSYLYQFNSADVLAAPDVWELGARRHFRSIFPSAPAGAEDKIVKAITKRILSGADAKEIAKTEDTVEIRILPELHEGMVADMKATFPNVKAAVPIEATHALEEGPPTQAPPPSTAPPGEVQSVNGQTVTLPKDLKPDERDKVLKVLKEITVPADPNQKPDQQPPELFLTAKAIELLLQIENRPEIIARLKGASGTGKANLLEYSIETAIADEAREQARKRLSLDEFTGSAREDPIVNRPVHGEIKNLTGYLVPTQEARFIFEVLDDRDAFRVPMISIQWFAYPKGEPNKRVDSEVTNYIPVRSEGLLNDKTFNVTFDKAGEYVIEALVQHNFFRPNTFMEPARVVTETALAEEINKEELEGFAGPGATTPHLYNIGGGGLQMGTVARGQLDPKATILSIENRLKTVADEEKLVRDLIAKYKGQDTREAKEVTKWAKNYLESIEESKSSLKKDKGGIPLGVRGVFVSRESEVPTKALTLLCYFFRTSGGYLLILRDFTQLYEKEDYRFEASDKTIEKSEEKAFLKQADAYPFGTLSITFQSYDETTKKPTTQFIRFEKITDTPEKKLKKFLFGTAVDIAVNLFAAILMIIPGLQVLGIVLAIAYNSAKVVSELEDAANKGTLTSGKIGIGLAQIALNVLPVAGRGAKILTIAGKSFYVMEAVNVAGNILLITQQGMSEVDKLRDGVIKELATLDDKIKKLESQNQAHPDLPDLKKRRKELIKEGEDATVNVFSGLLAQQAMMMVGQHLVMGYMSRKFSVGQLKTEGTFRHEKNAKARYDFKEGVIIGDELKISPAELDRFQLQHAQNKVLEGTVTNPADRQKIVEALGDRLIEIKTGAPATQLKQEGGTTVLEVQTGAKAADILSEAQKVSTLPPPPAEKPPPPPPKKGEAATTKEAKPAPEDTFKPVEPKKEPVVEKEPTVEKPPPDEKTIEAQAEIAPSLEAQAKAAYQAAKKKGYGGKYTEEQFIEQYKKNKIYDLETDHWINAENVGKPPPEPFPAGTKADMIVERLTGTGSKSSFKEYFEMLKKQGIADDAKLRATVEEVRKEFDLDTKASTVDDVRHALKEKFRPEVVKRMFEAPDGTKLDPKASHKKMLEVTEKLNSADKGTLTEEWVQKTREAAGVTDAPQKVNVKQSDHPAMSQNRQLDRIEGESINEIKSTDDYLSTDDKAEISDHLKLIGTEGATITVKGKPRILKSEKLTFLHPEGARKNLDYIIEQLEAHDNLSVEVFNNAGESKVFTKSDVTGANKGKMHEFLGKKYKP